MLVLVGTRTTIGLSASTQVAVPLLVFKMVTPSFPSSTVQQGLEAIGVPDNKMGDAKGQESDSLSYSIAR